MNNYFIAAAMLVVFAVAFIAIPILRQTRKKDLQVSNANVIKQRIHELEEEVEQGLISEKDKASAINELKLALVEETHLENADHTEEKLFSKKLVATLSIPGIIIGLWVYFETNHLNQLAEYKAVLANVEELTERVLSNDTNQVSANDYARYALIIRERLRSAPNDAQGWMYLGQTQLAIGRVDDSIAAFERSLRIQPNSNDTRYRYINALIANASESSLNKAQSQIEFLISTEPDNAQYRLLQTVIAVQRNDVQTATENFMAIKGFLAVDTEFYQSLIVQLRSIGVDEAILDSPQNTAITSIDVEILMIPELKAKLPSDGYLIVFAQDAVSESKVPLAVKRIAVPTFPAMLNLSVNDAMMPNMTIENSERLNITARISTDANVAVAPGELQGEVLDFEPVLGQKSTTKITINQELQ